jgi:predicted phage tail protein
MEAVAAEGRAMKELLLSSLSPEELQSVLDDRLPASRRGADEVVEDAADACRALLAAAQEHTQALQAENAQLQKAGADAATQQVAAAEKQVSCMLPAKLVERCGDGVEDKAAEEASWERIIVSVLESVSRASGSAFSASAHARVTGRK